MLLILHTKIFLPSAALLRHGIFLQHFLAMSGTSVHAPHRQLSSSSSLAPSPISSCSTSPSSSSSYNNKYVTMTELSELLKIILLQVPTDHSANQQCVKLPLPNPISNTKYKLLEKLNFYYIISKFICMRCCRAMAWGGSSPCTNFFTGTFHFILWQSSKFINKKNISFFPTGATN